MNPALAGRLDAIDTARRARTDAQTTEREARSRLAWLRMQRDRGVQFDLGSDYREGTQLRLTVTIEGYGERPERLRAVGQRLSEACDGLLFTAICEAQARLAREHEEAVRALRAAEERLAAVAGQPAAEGGDDADHR